MYELSFFVSCVTFLLSGTLYGIYYGQAESIVCIRIHLAKMPLRDFYHFCGAMYKSGLVLVGVSLSIILLCLFKLHWTFSLFFLLWLALTVYVSLFFFERNFNGTGTALLERDESWKFSTGNKWLDKLWVFTIKITNLSTKVCN